MTAAPLLYEVAARPWLARLSAQHGRRVTLGDVPDEEVDALSHQGFDYLWPTGVWRAGAEAGRIARKESWLRERWVEAFPGEAPELVGSPFAVAEYAVADDLGGDAGLDLLRRRLSDAGVGLILDFVPHHTATDGPWVLEHPDWYVAGSSAQRAADPSAYFGRPLPGTDRWLAHCRDPYFPPWTDAAPLDYRNPAVHEAMTEQLRVLAGRCDGVRADMAMLVLADVFHSTWNERSLPPAGDGAVGEFWATAIEAVHRDRPDFLLIAEAYWGSEWRLQQLGFDYTYDKTFSDRLVAGDGPGLAAHLRAGEDYQRHSLRFLENHDEPRAAATLPASRHRMGAVLAATSPGMFLIHDGQLDGARVRAPVQFARRPDEPAESAIRHFYDRLLDAIRNSGLRRGTSVRLDPMPAWEGNRTHEAFDARLWSGPGESLHLAVVNVALNAGQCYVPIPEPGLAGRAIVLEDLLGDARYERPGDELRSPGLFLDLEAEAYHLFRVRSSTRDDLSSRDPGRQPGWRQETAADPE